MKNGMGGLALVLSTLPLVVPGLGVIGLVLSGLA
jgi:hypothetical protein